MVKWRREACLSSMTILFSGARPATVLASDSSTVREELPSVMTRRAMRVTRCCKRAILNTDVAGVQHPDREKTNGMPLGRRLVYDGHDERLSPGGSRVPGPHPGQAPGQEARDRRLPL